MQLQFIIRLEIPKFVQKLFPCKHDVASVEENYDSRYGSHTSYLMCLKCGRKAMDIERNCKHKEDTFGNCYYCKTRLSKHDCVHKWIKEPDTSDFYCDNCGEWKDEFA